MSSPGQPTWLLALMVVFAIAAAVSFGFLLERNAQQAAYLAQFTVLKDIELPALRTRQGALTTESQRLDQVIAARRARLAATEEQVKIWSGDIDRIVDQNRTRLGEMEGSMRKEVQTYQEKMREAPERRAEVGREEERAYGQEREFDDNRRKLRDEIETEAQSLEIQKKKGRAELAKLDSRIAELEGRVKFLANQIDEASRVMKPAGQILDAEAASSGFVVIDRGLKHNLRKGTRFTVFCVRGGRNVVKGMIEVVSISERIANCRVIDEKNRNDPFIAGDKLHNPIYDPDRTKVFAIRGDFARFSRAELERFIGDAGGRVDPDIKIGTDFLVAGTAADKWTDIAVKLGVSILSEEQLLDFIRPQE